MVGQSTPCQPRHVRVCTAAYDINFATPDTFIGYLVQEGQQAAAVAPAAAAAGGSAVKAAAADQDGED
jgi:hypothetical protein